MSARGEENHERELNWMDHSRRQCVRLHVVDRDHGLVKLPAQVLRKLIPNSVVWIRFTKNWLFKSNYYLFVKRSKLLEVMFFSIRGYISKNIDTFKGVLNLHGPLLTIFFVGLRSFVYFP